MWELKIAAEAGDDTHLFSINNFIGRQIWEFDANSGSPEELDEVDRAPQNFSGNRSRFKASADLLWRMQFLKEKKFEQKIPQVEGCSILRPCKLMREQTCKPKKQHKEKRRKLGWLSLG